MKVVIFPAENKISKKTGLVPIYVRIRNEFGKKEFRSSLELAKQDLIFWDPFTQTFSNPRVPLFHEILELHVRLNSSELESNFSNNEFLKSVINGRVQKKVSIEKKWIVLLQKYYQDKVIKSSLSAGTKKNYRVAIEKMTRFLQLEELTDIEIGEVNFQFASNFLQHMYDISITGMRENTALGHIKKFRKIMDYFIDMEYVSKNPFKRIKLDGSARKRYALELDDVVKIFEHVPKSNSNVINHDVTKFCLLTGLAYVDVFSLNKNNINCKPEGVIMTLLRAKTDIETYQVLPTVCMDLLNKYSQQPYYEITGRYFPTRSNQKFNLYLKSLAKELEIDKNISTHILRHTFRSIIEDANINNMKVVKYMMGHTLLDDIDGTYNHSKKMVLFKEAANQLNLFIADSVVSR